MKAEFPGTLEWLFPLPEPGTGVLMGNGKMGLMVWGRERLSITVSRNGFWDRREGAFLRAGTTFSGLKRLLEAGDARSAAQLFTRSKPPVHYNRPTQLPCARLELVAEGWMPHSAELDLLAGVVTVRMVSRDHRRAAVVIRQARDLELAWMECDEELGPVRVATMAMWDFLGDTLAKDGCVPPVRWDETVCGGVCQRLPEDPALAMAWQWHRRKLVVATVLGENPIEPAKTMAQSANFVSVEKKTDQWWAAYWRDIPRLSLPDPPLQHAYLYGVYQQAGLTPPEGVAATLVGPWMEENYFPGWSNDYHFNINAQMIYWPCLATNRMDHLWPLWEMIRSWMPQLRANAKTFFEIEDGLMLPHAVNDHGKTVDDFWTGMIDHGCTAWMAQLAWLHYRYSLDERVLREIAWPLLKGAFNGYWAMLEECDAEGKQRLSLPITVSPEHGGDGADAWGRDASFQLAALHLVAAILPRAARILGEGQDSRWSRVREELPPYTTLAGPDVWDHGKKVNRIALWNGKDLEESHRHHSHLAAIYPFATVDPMAPEHRPVMVATLEQWIVRGSGCWAGWSLPWAASLCARCDLTDAAIEWLHWWRNVYSNTGHGSDHNADFAGCTLFGRGYLLSEDPDRRYRPVIQMDAAMGAITAILELLVQCRGDMLVVLPRIPRRWRSFSFDGIRTEGAFLVGATVENGLTSQVRITSLAGAPLRLRHPLGNDWRLNGEPQQGSILETSTQPRQQLVLTPK